MQGAQTASRFRGIGRYSLDFAKGIIRNRGDHDIILALNGAFPDSVEMIKGALSGLVDHKNIHVWHAPMPVAENTPKNESRRVIAELLREAFLASLKPDIIHICSLFEGYEDNAVTSIGNFDQQTPISVSFYDLIPLVNSNEYLKPNPTYSQFYYRKLDYLKKANFFLAISDFSCREGINYLGLSEANVVNISAALNENFYSNSINYDGVLNHLHKKFNLSRRFILYAGAADERKNLHRLIRAYSSLPNYLQKSHHLVFAGGVPEEYLMELKKTANSVGLKQNDLIFTQRVSDEDLISLYRFCELFVFPSWHEGFGLPALEAMACGAPVIGSNGTSLTEVINFNDAMFDPFNESDMMEKIKQVLTDDSLREKLSNHGLQQAKLFSWDETGKRAIAAWEGVHANNIKSRINPCAIHKKLYGALAPYVERYQDSELLQISACLGLNHQIGARRQLLVDISELIWYDAKTGIQRVVHNTIEEWLTNPPPGYRIEPIYATLEQGYRYARRFTANIMASSSNELVDEPVDFASGDIFLGLDYQPQVQVVHREFYQFLRMHGVNVFFIVYDLLCLQMPQYFPSGAAKNHANWLETVLEGDGAICISKAVEDELILFIEENKSKRPPQFKTGWFHLGANISKAKHSQDFLGGSQETLQQLSKSYTFLMVGTLEPRKGHAQVLDAYEQLWQKGININLLIVGKQGWQVDGLVKRLNNHAELNKQLFWFEGVSDDYLQKIYKASTCLIAASYGEGFGLPLIEAAQYGLPIIARDIPVFREVGNEHIYYFRANQAIELSNAIEMWLSKYKLDEHPNSSNISWLTWKESSEQLLKAINLSAKV